MTLEVKKSTTLQGYSKIDGQQVVFLNASITKENAGNSTVSQNIQNQELYAANRTECRQDIADFQNTVYEVEDEFLAELNAGE